MSSDAGSEMPQRSGTFRAVVQSGGTITSYLRAGAGRPVLLLSLSGPGDPTHDALVGTLGSSFRILVPHLSALPVPLSEWLVPFLDGLGLAEVAVIAESELAPALFQCVQSAPDRISRIVILSPETGWPETEASGRPVFCVGLDRPAEELVAQVAWFLAGAPDVIDPSPA